MLMVSTAYAVPARAADLVTLLDSTATLPAEPTATVTFPLTAATGVDLTKLDATVLRLRRGDVEIGVPDGLTATVDAQAGTLKLAVPADAMAVHGTYAAVVSITDGSTRQLATITLTRSSAVVSAPSTVRAERTLSLTGDVDGSDKSPRVTLGASPDTRVLSLTQRQVEAEDPVIELALPEAQPGKALIEPGGALTVDYMVTGKVAPGTVTRTVQLNSPQLAQPVQVTFTIVAKRTTWWIALGLLLGVLLGLVLRTALPRLAAWRVAQTRRKELLEQLAQWRADYQDPEFATGIAEVISTLKTTKVSGLTKANEKATTDATALLDALKMKLTTLTERHRTGVAVFASDWQLPADRKEAGGAVPLPGFTTGVEKAKRQLAKAHEALQVRDAATATTALDAVDDQARRLASDGRGWLARVGPGLQLVDQSVTMRRKGALGNFAAALQVITSAATPLPADDAAAQVTRAKSTLERIHEVTGAYAVLGTHLAVLADEAETAADLLGPTDGKALREAAQSLRRVDPGDDPTTDGPTVGRAVKRVVDHAAAAVGLDKASAAVKERFAEGALVEAADQAVKDRAGSVLGVGTAPPAAAEATPTRIPVPASAPRDAAGVDVTTSMVDLPSAAMLRSVRAGEVVLHVLVAAIVVLITGYALFLPTWTGVYADFLQVVAWGFAVDVSVAGLTTLLQASRKPATSE